MSKPKLTIELVPKSSWYSNVRSNVPKETWDRLRKMVYAKAGHVCEICGGVGKKHPVECHEVWEYDEVNGMQTLIRLIALCPACHSVKHIGRAHIYGGYDQAVKHLSKVNGWTIDEAHLYTQEQFLIWTLRSKLKWSVNIDALKQYNQTGKVEGAW